MTVDSPLQQLKSQLDHAVIGQQHLSEALLIALLSNGNLLLEGMPGTAKTRAIKSLADAMKVDFGRIQFTPDLLPSDVTGTEVYSQLDGVPKLQFQPGPIFNNLILADEINRAPAKVQAALLEAMEERQVTIAGHSHALPALFMVLATQNPIEQEGTYPLPEAQMDRFLMKVIVDYPNDETEAQIIELVRAEEAQTEQAPLHFDSNWLNVARQQVQSIHVSKAIVDYIVALVMLTRKPERAADSELSRWIVAGASPRASLAIDKSARAMAYLQGRSFVDPDDVKAVVHRVLRHRLILSYEAQANGISADDVIDEIIRNTALA
ncbi:AAA family ATPase [Ferrimonas lipolytica]|uniref:MoxR family ATPase n=1 Tax=Ferrimonas lipolytica TaxID=2724191 RepID=A0A6H1UCG9_9GAMM|nr:MoxR family ATPase [Ferrimonas lipolytica]QIZ76538.1 MoxR family ATPase [Ferrimonas lipolytica]